MERKTKESIENQIRINRLQQNLTLIRKAGGWTTEEFGQMIGLTKQTVSKLEHGDEFHNTMTKIQYIAIRAVIEHELNDNPDNEDLAAITNVTFSPDLTEEERINAQVAYSIYFEAERRGMDKAKLFSQIAAFVGTVALELLTSPTTHRVVEDWLGEVIRGKRK